MMNKPSKSLTIERLQRSAGQIPDLQQRNHGTPDFQTWHRSTETALINAFGETNRHVDAFKKISYTPWDALFSGGPNPDYQRAYITGLTSAGALLKAAIEEVEEYWDDDVPVALDSGGTQTDMPLNTGEVFVIHGQDHGIKETVARFLELLDLKPVILHEQPDEGRTIIEKFEYYANGFAVALLTPDDVGGPDNENLQPRARQNVILELGYFVGKFGRGRVCALKGEGVEVPSDYSGVLYIPLDESEGWKMALIREMRSAGFDIDTNRAFQ